MRTKIPIDTASDFYACVQWQIFLNFDPWADNFHISSKIKDFSWTNPNVVKMFQIVFPTYISYKFGPLPMTFGSDKNYKNAIFCEFVYPITIDIGKLNED